jgi:hypothetical protein
MKGLLAACAFLFYSTVHASLVFDFTADCEPGFCNWVHGVVVMDASYVPGTEIRDRLELWHSIDVWWERGFGVENFHWTPTISFDPPVVLGALPRHADPSSAFTPYTFHVSNRNEALFIAVDGGYWDVWSLHPFLVQDGGFPHFPHGSNATFTLRPAQVSEPGTLALLAGGVLLLGALSRRK